MKFGFDCQAVGRRKSLKTVYEDDDGRSTEEAYTVSSPCEPNGSGELKVTYNVQSQTCTIVML